MNSKIKDLSKLVSEGDTDAAKELFKELLRGGFGFYKKPPEETSNPLVPRQYTKDECLDMFMHEVAGTTRYWMNLPDTTKERACSGLAFSILVILDGGTNIPALSLVPSPHPGDEEFLREEGENWWPTLPEEIRPFLAEFNSADAMHEIFYEYLGERT